MTHTFTAGNDCAVPGRGAGRIVDVDISDIATVRLYVGESACGDTLRLPVAHLAPLHAFSRANQALLREQQAEIAG